LVSVYSLYAGGVGDVGRLAGGGTTYSNPNDLALVMVIGAPILMFIAGDSTRSLLQRMAAVVLLAPLAMILLSTGSRGGVLGFMAIAGFLLWYQSWAVRIRISLGLAVLGAIAIATTPDIMLKRLTTFMTAERTADAISDTKYTNDGQKSEDYTGIAAASAQGRWHLTQQGIALLVQNPVIGAGFGMFMVAENELSMEAGASRGAWKGAHNMYLQVGSENGFVGLYLFLSILYASWTSFRAHRALPPGATIEHRQLQNAAFALSASMVGFLVSGAFLTVGYDYFVPMYAALAVGFNNVAELEQQKRRAAEKGPDDDSPVEAVRGQIDWTRGPGGVPAPAQLRQGA
jgi:O-antigen ligase